MGSYLGPIRLYGGPWARNLCPGGQIIGPILGPKLDSPLWEAQTVGFTSGQIARPRSREPHMSLRRAEYLNNYDFTENSLEISGYVHLVAHNDFVLSSGNPFPDVENPVFF